MASNLYYTILCDLNKETCLTEATVPIRHAKHGLSEHVLNNVQQGNVLGLAQRFLLLFCVSKYVLLMQRGCTPAASCF